MEVYENSFELENTVNKNSTLRIFASNMSSASSLSLASVAAGPRSNQQAVQSIGRRRQRHVSKLAACLACRRREARCDGNRPLCDACGRQGQECDYDVEPELSRYLSMQQKRNAVQARNGNLQNLLHQIRDGGSEDVF